MSQIMKAFTGIFIVMFMMVSATGILAAFLQIMQAQNLHAVIVDELENSHYTYSVLESAFEAANDRGYELRVVLYQQYESEIICTSVEELPMELEEVVMAEVALSYPVELAFFQVAGQQQIIGYAR